MSDEYQTDEWGQYRTDFLYHHVQVAADKLGVTILSTPEELTFTGEMRSIGVHARDDTGDVWLRTVMDDPAVRQLCRWDGNVKANAFRGVPKPTIIRWAEWFDPEWHESHWNEKGDPGSRRGRNLHSRQTRLACWRRLR